MGVSGSLAIFSKTPGLTPAKTRLAAGIGSGPAEEFFLLSIQATRSLAEGLEASTGGACSRFWALAEATGPIHPFWDGERAVWTGKGGLGERLDRMYRRALRQGGKALVIGSDSPFLRLGVLEDSWRRLDAHPGRLVIGPSFDGGFYLFGGRIDVPPSVWNETLYSRPDTLDRLRRGLASAGLEWTELAPHGDIDTRDDLIAAGADSSSLLPGQVPAREWIARRYPGNGDQSKEIAS
jgi:uncharacterized protein